MIESLMEKYMAGQWTLGHASVIDIVEEIETASPRVTIVVGVALIDDCLTDALVAYSALQEKKFLDRCYGDRGAIREFSVKADLGAAFGIYGPVTHSDLLKLRDMRNLAAHKTNKHDFSSAKIKGLCRDLALPGQGLRPTLPEPKGARERFIYTVSLTTDFLMTAAFAVKTLKKGPTYPKFRLP